MALNLWRDVIGHHLPAIGFTLAFIGGVALIIGGIILIWFLWDTNKKWWWTVLVVVATVMVAIATMTVTHFLGWWSSFNLGLWVWNFVKFW